MEWTKASLAHMDLSNMVQFSFIFFDNIWGSFLCCPDCPQMKRIPLTTITSTIKVQILHVMACWKALWISHLPKKFQKIQWQIGIVDVCPKSLNSIYGSHGPLGVKIQFWEVVINAFGSIFHVCYNIKCFLCILFYFHSQYFSIILKTLKQWMKTIKFHVMI